MGMAGRKQRGKQQQQRQQLPLVRMLPLAGCLIPLCRYLHAAQRSQAMLSHRRGGRFVLVGMGTRREQAEKSPVLVHC